MVSQSIFLVNVTVYDTNGSPANGTWEPEETYYTSVTDCGYSNMAIILAIILAGITVIFLLGNSLRRLQPGIPVAGGCSAVISAACHVLDDRDVSIYKAVKWGAVKENVEGVPGHCCITSRLDVASPTQGHFYAEI
jgi:hypothetical protein